MRFRTTVLLGGKTATGFVVPDEVVAALDAGKRPAVTVTINGYSYPSTVARMGGQFLLPLAAEHRLATGQSAGDEIEVDVELDTAPREVVVPPDFAQALDAEPPARAFFDGLSYSQQRWFVLSVESAKTAATRQRRVDAALDRLRSGRGQR